MTQGTEAITTLHMLWMVALAVLAVVGIVWGVRLKRRRVQAERQVEQRAAEAGVEVAPHDPAPLTDDALARTALPVAPSPPPLADMPAPGTPPTDEPAAPRPLADEPIAAVIEPEGTPATIAADAAETSGVPDPADGPVTQLKGLGPRVAARLAELGIERVGQLAALGDAEVADLDARMGPFTGRIARDRWLEQARLLASGNRAEFELIFGKL